MASYESDSDLAPGTSTFKVVGNKLLTKGFLWPLCLPATTHEDGPCFSFTLFEFYPFSTELWTALCEAADQGCYFLAFQAERRQRLVFVMELTSQYTDEANRIHRLRFCFLAPNVLERTEDFLGFRDGVEYCTIAIG